MGLSISGSIGLTVICLLCLTIYRTVYHPLARYPGPWLACMTSAYGAYHSARGDIHLDIKNCHERYGPIVRYGPNRLIFRSPRALHDIYGFGNTLTKSSSYLTMVPWKDGWTVITCLDKDLHRNMRSTLQSGLSKSTLQEFEGVSLRNITTLIGKLIQDANFNGWSSPKNMTTLAKWYAIDTMSSLAFGRNIGLLDNPALRYIVDVFDLYTWRTGFFEQWPRLWFTGIESLLGIGRHISPLAKKFGAWREAYTVAAINANNETNLGVFSGLAFTKPATAMYNGTLKSRYRYTRSQMEAEGSFILLVAGDSNATAISASLFYLSRYPSVLERLAKEIRSTFASVTDIHLGDRLNSCVYLRAVIAEILRIHPPSPGVPWRETELETIIDDVAIPAGIDVGCSLYSVHHDALIFQDPSKFWPERWLSGTLSEDELRRANFACKPFSLGPRSCAGRAVAMNELLLVLSSIVHSCDFRVPDGRLGRVGEGFTERRVFQFETHFTAVTDGPWLEFKKRDQI